MCKVSALRPDASVIAELIVLKDGCKIGAKFDDYVWMPEVPRGVENNFARFGLYFLKDSVKDAVKDASTSYQVKCNIRVCNVGSSNPSYAVSKTCPDRYSNMARQSSQNQPAEPEMVKSITVTKTIRQNCQQFVETTANLGLGMIKLRGRDLFLSKAVKMAIFSKILFKLFGFETFVILHEN